MNEQGHAVWPSLKLRLYRKEEGDEGQECENVGKEDTSKENGEPRGGGRKEQDHLARAGSGQVPVTPPQRPLSDTNAIRFLPQQEEKLALLD